MALYLLVLENIVLGPPKTSFASASRIFGKPATDSTERPSRINDSDDAKTDRYNFREKFFKDREAGDKDFDRRDTKLGAANNRRGGRDDKDDWNHGRPRRGFGQDEPERRPRRNGDQDRWDGRERDRDQQDSGYDRGSRDKETRPSKRDGQGRGRHEQSWFREDSAQDAPEAEEDKSSVRNREWRRDRQGADRDWNRPARVEQDPEWLDSTERHEPRQTHTQEDFQRWKERMKASSAQQQPEERKKTPSDQAMTTGQKGEAKHMEGEMFSNLGTPFQMDSGLERFFGLLGDNKLSHDTNNPSSAESKKEITSTKATKSSRFAGFFSPPVESPSKESDHTRLSSDRPLSTEADQEGFQRILQMLGGSKSRNTTPQVDSTQQPGPPSLTEKSRPSTTLSSPVGESTSRQDHVTLQDGPSRNLTAAEIEPLLPQNPPKETDNVRDRENLLRLMQQVQISSASNQAHGNVQPQTAGHTPGILNVPDLLSRPQGIAKVQKTPNFLDDPAITNMQRPDMDLADQVRRPTNGPPVAYYNNEIHFAGIPQGGHSINAGAPGRAHQGHGQPPMGIQRPPGFDQLPPLGWTGQQFPPQQGGGPTPLAPPPGIPNPSRGMNPNFFASPMPMHGGMLPSNERQPFPRGTTGNGAGSFGPPPGMLPPPGYMNINGQPPSVFPPMPHNPDTLMGFAHNVQGNFAGGHTGLSGAPPPSRHLDMFAQANGGDGRNGMLGPGPFR